MVGSSKLDGSGPNVWYCGILGAGRGWCESRELLEGDGDARAESTSTNCGTRFGDCTCEGGDSEDELPEAASFLSFCGDGAPLCALRGSLDSVVSG